MTALVATNAAAQAVAVGTVRDDSTGQPIRDAEVLIEALGRRTVTDAQGRFVISGLAPGIRMLFVRAVGYHPFGLMVQFTANDTVRRDIPLEPMVVHLEPIEVTQAPPRGPRGMGREAFEERRRLGFGQFIDSTMLRRSEHLTVPGVLRHHTSIYLRQTRGGMSGGGIAMSSRSRDRSGRYDCYMQVVMDGLVIHRGGKVGADPGAAGAPDLKLLIDVSQLEAIEVYRSASEIPIEFSGPTAACGVIVLWTRRGP